MQMKTLTSCLRQIRRKSNTAVFTVLLGLAICCSSAMAQSGAGSIQGTITDSSGAVIAGASIHVVQVGTNASFDTKSNEVGFYQVPSLFTGTYTVTITSPGFKTAVTTRPGMIFPESAAYLTALPRVSLNGNYQDARILPVLTSGAATAMWNGFRRIDAA